MRKKIFAFAAALLMLFNLTAFAANDRVPILLYHNITDSYDIHQKLVNITPDALRAHLEAIKNAGYNTITYKDFYQAVVGIKNLPENPILITFDDGYLSNYQYAFPLLKELNMNATIFIVTGSVGNYKLDHPHFNWDEAREMDNSGFVDIQSHTHSHRDFHTLTPYETLYEVRMSKYLIEKNLGKNVSAIAYPYGFDNEYSQDIIKSAGFSMINYVGNVGSNGVDEGLDKLKRITVAGDWTPDKLLEILKQNIGK